MAPSKKETLTPQVSARIGLRAWREDKGSRRKNQVVADLSPVLPGQEDGVQEIVCKVNREWLKSGC